MGWGLCTVAGVAGRGETLGAHNARLRALAADVDVLRRHGSAIRLRAVPERRDQRPRDEQRADRGEDVGDPYPAEVAHRSKAMAQSESAA